jgi:sn-glycerol 3-phosphate transport system substrate-binding protein
MSKFIRSFGVAAALAASLFGRSALAATEITFYYPIAVGGPITKVVDGYAAAFQKHRHLSGLSGQGDDCSQGR